VKMATLPKPMAERIGRMFNLLFNRVSMYHLEHPSTRESVEQLTSAVQEGLQYVSPLAVILDRERIYIEEEPLDPRVNPQRLVAHMKKAGVQSVSFQKGLTTKEVTGFARVFADTKTFPTAEDMKRGLLQQGVQRIRINHVFFRKMTADEEVVEKGQQGMGGIGSGLTQVLIDTSSAMREGGLDLEAGSTEALPSKAVPKGFLQALSLPFLLEDPEGVSQRLLDAMEPVEGEGKAAAPEEEGAPLVEGIRHLREQLEAAGSGLPEGRSMEDLVEAVFKLREQLREGMAQRRQRGELSVRETLVQREMDDLTDQVVVQLVRDEYRSGKISVRRLAQLIRRMMPDVRELKRLLPKLKEALLADGMPLSDYLQLIRELERELQSEELALILEEGAEEIGLSVEEIIQEVRRDPKGAAELIVLASEVRALGKEDDRETLKRILVDYVERVGGELAVDRVRGEGAEGVRKLDEVLAQIQEELVQKLRSRLADTTLAMQVRRELDEKRPASLEALRQEWILRYALSDTQVRSDPRMILRLVGEAYPEPERQGQVLEAVVEALQAKGVDAAPLQAALARQSGLAPGEADSQKVPKGTFNRATTLFLLREEVKRARRYRYLFSGLLVGVRQAVSLKPVPIGMIRPHEIRNVLMKKMRGYLREVDLVGSLEDNRILVLLPFTGKAGAEAVGRRLLQHMDGQTLSVRNIPMKVRIVLSKTTFVKDHIPDLKSFVELLEKELTAELARR